jgi:uncharacterized protein (TIGR00106 family)
MSMLVEFSVVPVGKGVSISPQIAEVLKIVVESGISYKANPMSTVLEGDWDSVMAVIRKCHNIVMKNSERAQTTIIIDDRERIEKKLESVEQKLGMKLKK